MSFTTYAGLKTSVTSWMDISSSDLSTKIDDLVTLAENRIFRECRTKDCEVSINSPIASGVVAVPSDYMSLKFAYLDGSPTRTLERRSAEWIYNNVGSAARPGKPDFIGRDGANFIFGPYADSGYTVKGTYYGRAGTLSTAVYNLFLNNPDLYLFACLAESELLIGRDTRITLWEAKYNKILNDVNGLDKMEGASGSSLQMRVG